MGSVASFQLFAGFRGDYLSDRIIRIYTLVLFVLMAIIIAIQMSREDSVTCWAPSHFTQQHTVFTNSLCKMENAGTSTMVTFSENRAIGDESSTVNFSRMRTFPIVLSLQSLLFLIPWLLWKLTSGSICSLDGVINEACLQKYPRSESGFAIFKNIQKLLLEPCSVLGTTGGGFALSFSYILTKLFYWIICVIQMAIISSYFDINFFTFRTGHYLWEPYTYTNTSDIITIYENITTVSTMNETITPFPRMVLCMFQLQIFWNIHQYRVQCAVNVAETTEHCLTLIWIWLILVLVITSFSGVAQFLQMILRCVRSVSYKNGFLRKRLSGSESFNMASTEVIQKFSSMYLKPDLFFVVGMIEENGSISASVAALKELWEDFLKATKIQIQPQRLNVDDVRPLVDERYPGDRGHLIPGTDELQPHFNDAEAKF